MQFFKNISSLANWDVLKINSLEELFCGCKSLFDISPLQKWGVGNVGNINEMFKGCKALLSADLLDFWILKSIQNADNVFEDCENLKDYPAWYGEDGFKGTNEYLLEFDKLNKTTKIFLIWVILKF